MFKLDSSKELTLTMWETYVSVFQCRQQELKTNQYLFNRNKNSTSVITQYDVSIGKNTALVHQPGSKEDAQEKFLDVRLIQNSDEVRYYDLKIYMHNSYVYGTDRCPKTLSYSLNLIVNWRRDKRPPAQQYESSKGVNLKNKGNTGRFKGRLIQLW